jgi:hypothetical protein
MRNIIAGTLAALTLIGATIGAVQAGPNEMRDQVCATSCGGGH